MASSDLRGELLCSICLTTYTDPVMMRCGHNFCRVCIDRVLETQDGSGVYSCPECREEFLERPELMRCLALRNIMENLLITQPTQTETGIVCTYCIYTTVPAVKFCLRCEASLCDKHLSVHSKSAEHVLSNPRTSLENRKCSVHKKILEYYCTEDANYICVSCSLIGKHSGHEIVSLEKAYRKKKRKLRHELQYLTAKRRKTMKRVRGLEKRWREAPEMAAGEAERVTVLCTDIRRRLDILEKRVLSKIYRRKGQVSLSSLIQHLEIKKDGLYMQIKHIEELCNMSDPLTVLHDPDTDYLFDPEEEDGDEDTYDFGYTEDGDVEDVEDVETDDLFDLEEEGSDEATGRHDVGDEATGRHDVGDEATGGRDKGDEATGGRDKGDEATGGRDKGDEATGGHDGGDDTGGHDGGDDTGGHDGGDKDTEGHYKQGHNVDALDVAAISDTLHTLGDIITGIRRGIYVEDPADILLDVNTAANDIFISDDLKTATRVFVDQKRPETSERFQDYPQVMSSRGFSSGQHYWDVESSKEGRWIVGMCYPSIDRRGESSHIGNNNKSWSLTRYDEEYTVKHDGIELLLPGFMSSDRVRIYLDYEAELLSFFELGNPVRHLHTFTATFNEPLHAAFWISDGTMILWGSRN